VQCKVIANYTGGGNVNSRSACLTSAFCRNIFYGSWGKWGSGSFI